MQQGETGTAILQSRTQYFSRIAGTTTIYVPATQTVYRNTNRARGETTSFSYAWFSGRLQLASRTTTLPTVTVKTDHWFHHRDKPHSPPSCQQAAVAIRH